MAMKALFSNMADVLLDWDDAHNDDFCSWRGVFCDNVSHTVVSLNLSSLNLGGEISPAIGDLTNLQSIDLQGNKLTGQIPDEIGNCAALVHLDLSDNQLYGDIPFSLSKLKQLELLNLKSNQLTGPIPSTLSQIPNLKTLDLARNRLSGEIPRILYWNEVLQYLDISYNQITGEIPFNIGFLQVATLSLQGNRLTGKIPEVIGLMQALAILDLSENELVGSIPPILGNLTFTGKLQLNDNGLVGNIPNEFGKLEHLFELNLANNHLDGTIPHNISSCTALNQLNLSSNNFKGIIPVELGHIINLDTLNLSHNHLDGSLPAEFGNLRSIEILDLSFNNISGSIPPEIGQLQNLMSLFMNHNDLRGKIPDQLTNCFSLTSLNLSYNNLSGVIPSMKNFSWFSADSFLGNSLLCGDWLGSKCRPYIPKSREIFSRVAVVCLILGIMILLAMVFVAFYRSSQSKQLMKGTSGTGQGMLNGPPKLVILHMDMAIHTLDDIIRGTENLSEKYIIGYGASSTVYKCVLKNSRPIAIKRLYNQQPHNIREFETELETVGSIRHRNLVTLHGYALTPYGNLLFYDYMANGSLWDLLHGPLKVKLDWETRLRIAVGAAEGLAYLHHDCNPRIVHRDIKSSNILLDENFEAHLSDFGTAKCISTAKTHASTYVLGTIGYIDPEYARTSRLNEKSDVYSFGIVLLELLTGKKAVDNESNLHQLILSKADNNTVMEAVDPEVSITCTDLAHVKKTFQLALLCTKKNPSERPSMHEVARVLVSLLPSPPSKILAPPAKKFDYAHFVIEKGQQRKMEEQKPQQDNNSSNAQWFVRFGDVISKST
ncbi:ERECTA-like kinase [Glycine max]|nr:ERECTA-like kinase [Glycine max]ACM89517.1 ERECTA-like kinase [Glycine max]|eukprot:NP_001237639.1 ERECTA-like kinase [Glycine max]